MLSSEFKKSSLLLSSFLFFYLPFNCSKDKILTSLNILYLLINSCIWKQLWDIITVASRYLRPAIELLGSCNKIFFSWNYIIKLFQFCFCSYPFKIRSNKYVLTVPTWIKYLATKIEGPIYTEIHFIWLLLQKKKTKPQNDYIRLKLFSISAMVMSLSVHRCVTW